MGRWVYGHLDGLSHRISLHYRGVFASYEDFDHRMVPVVDIVRIHRQYISPFEARFQDSFLGRISMATLQSPSFDDHARA
jgi:hypothetical protein